MPRIPGAAIGLTLSTLAPTLAPTLALPLASCGREEPAAPAAEFGELCGEEGPLRLLELGFDKLLKQAVTLRTGDRIYALVARFGSGELFSISPPTVDPEVWSMGPCGESPRRVAGDVDRIFTVEHMPDVVLGCRAGPGEIVSFDPEGARPPHVVFGGLGGELGCGLGWTAHGLLNVQPVDEEHGALVLYPYPDDPHTQTSQPVTLLDSIRLSVPSPRVYPGIRSMLKILDEYALAITTDDNLVRVDFEGGAVEVEQTGVHAIMASADGRYLLWQSSTRTNDDPDHVEGLVSLRDRETGEDRPLDEAVLNDSMFVFNGIEQGFVALQLGPPEAAFVRVYRLFDLHAVDLRVGELLTRVLDERRWLIGDARAVTFDIFDPVEGSRTSFFPGQVLPERFLEDRVEVLEVPPCCIEGSPTDEGELWSVPFDGGEKRRLARRATRYDVRTPDGSVVTALDLDGALRGTLVVVDPETEQERVIDEGVVASTLHTSPAFDPDVVVYSVSDGERSGVYLARLPAE